MRPKGATRDPYLVKSVVHASEVLGAFRSSGEALPLREVARAQRVAQEHGVPAALHARALRHGREGRREPVSLVPASVQAASRIGSATPRRAPTISSRRKSRRACSARPRREGIELICVDNRYNPKIAQRNADVLVREKVDLRHRVPDRRARRADRRREVPRGEHPADRDRDSASRARPISAPTTTRPASSAAGTSAAGPSSTGTARSTRSCSSRSIAPAACRRCGSPACSSGMREVLPAARALPRHVSRRRRQARRELRSDAPAPPRQPSRAASWSARSTIRARSARCARFRKRAAPSRRRSWARTPRPKAAPNCASPARG